MSVQRILATILGASVVFAISVGISNSKATKIILKMRHAQAITSSDSDSKKSMCFDINKENVNWIRDPDLKKICMSYIASK